MEDSEEFFKIWVQPEDGDGFHILLDLEGAESLGSELLLWVKDFKLSQAKTEWKHTMQSWSEH